jgi:putative tryptophan/tyrosine transport system substrate-binding protein
MKRRKFIALVGGAVAAWPLAAHPQQPTIPVIGFLHSLSADRSTAVLAAFHQGLRDAGYVAGQNVAIEYRWGEGYYDRLPALVADLVIRKVDVIVTGGGTEPILAAKRATSTIPIIFSVAADPIASGLVASLGRPGGNVTGVSTISVDLLPKRLELLSELLPRATEFGLLVNPSILHSEHQIAVAQGAARTKGVQLHILRAGTPDEIDAAFLELAKLHVDALVVSDDALYFNQRVQFAVLAARYSLPAIYGLSAHVIAGGLISYGPSLVGAYRQAAAYVTRVLAGARPADLPVEQPTKFELVINLRAAKALGLTIPPTLLARADEVIE